MLKKKTIGVGLTSPYSQESEDHMHLSNYVPEIWEKEGLKLL